MQRQVVQATILCLAAMTLCGCSSGFHWPWSKQTADADLSATDPGLAVAAPAVGARHSSQVAQNTQLPSGYSGPPAGANGYPPAVAQRTGYGGGFADATPAARPAYAPASVPVGYDTASTYNAQPTGNAYPPPAYQPAANPSIGQESPPRVAYDNSTGALAANNGYGAPRNTPAGAGPANPSYPPAATYAATPPTPGAYPQASAQYAAPANTAPSAMEDANNPYRGPRYTLTSSRPQFAPPAGSGTQPDIGTAQYGLAAAQSGGYPAADPFGAPAAAPVNVAPVPQSYGPPTQPYVASAPYASSPPAPANVAPAAPLVADNRYDAGRYNSQPSGNSAISPIAVDTHPPVPAPSVENHYAMGDPLLANSYTANSAAPLQTIPAAQPATDSQFDRAGSANELSTSPGYPATARVAVENSELPPATIAAPPITTSQLGDVPSRSTMRKIGKPGEPLKAKRTPDSKTAANQRPHNRPELNPEQTDSERPSAAKVRNPDEASSRYKNPLRDSD